MEFIQFHPTCLYHPQERWFPDHRSLAVKGRHLRLPDGTRFMPEHDERGELALRDIVARAIDFEMKSMVWITSGWMPPTWVRPSSGTFPHHPRPLSVTGHRHCTPAYSRGACSPLHLRWRGNRLAWPHRPAWTVCRGRTTYTGLYGANRLASNLCWSAWCWGEPARKTSRRKFPSPCPNCRAGMKARSRMLTKRSSFPQLGRVAPADVELCGHCAHHAPPGAPLLHRILLLRSEIDDYYAAFRVTRDLLELRNLVDCAELIVRSALSRQESRGLHFSRDYPEPCQSASPPFCARRPKKDAWLP